MSVNVQVSIRCRPFNSREKRQNEAQVVRMQDKTIFLGGKDQAGRKFNFDHCFDSFDPKDEKFASQDTVYDAIGTQVIDQSFQGFNACVFAYGQTGSGKSYSIMGSKEEPGIVPRLCTNLFTEIEKRRTTEVSFHVETSMIEIYNEKVKDLFNPGNPKNEKGLKVREHPKTGPYVDGLAYCVVKSGEEILALLDEGNKYRTIAATQMNHTSSRAHTIFTIKMSIRTKVKTIVSMSTSRINLIDLAGSERVAKTGATGVRFKEGTSINLSLICLGNVIEQLAKRSNPRNVKAKKKIFVRFRDSTLTWLLKDSLGGNSRTFMIATISPAAFNYPETLSTLRYADRAKKIRTKPKKNEDENARIIRELRDEIKKLKELLAGRRPLTPQINRNLVVNEEEERKKQLEYERLKAQNEKLQKQLQENEDLVDKLKLSEEDRSKQSELLAELRKKELEKKFGLVNANFMEEHRRKFPHIINLAEDPSQSGSLIYFFEKQVTSVGGMDADVKLSGLGIQDFHCEITKTDVDQHCKLQVMDELAIVHVNGKKVEANDIMELFQGDSIIFGNRFVFKYLNPFEVGKKRKNVEEEEVEVEEVEGEEEEEEDNNNKSISINGIQVSPIKKKKEPNLMNPQTTATKEELSKALDFTEEQLVDEYERIREEHLKELAKEQFSKDPDDDDDDDESGGSRQEGFNQRQLVQLVESMTMKEKKAEEKLQKIQQQEQPPQPQQRRGTIRREAKKWFEELKMNETKEIEQQKKKASGALEQIKMTYEEDISQLESVIKCLTNTKKSLDHQRYQLNRIRKLERKREEFEVRIQEEKEKSLMPRLNEIVLKIEKLNTSQEEEEQKLNELKKKRKELQNKIQEIFQEDENNNVAVLNSNYDSLRKEKEIEDTERLIERFDTELNVYKGIKQFRKEKKEKDENLNEKRSSSSPEKSSSSKKSKKLSKKNIQSEEEEQQQQQQQQKEEKKEESNDQPLIPIHNNEEEQPPPQKDDNNNNLEQKKIEKKDDEEDVTNNKVEEEEEKVTEQNEDSSSSSSLTEEELDEKIYGNSKKLKTLKEKLRNLENGSFLRTKNMLHAKKKEAQLKLDAIEHNIQTSKSFSEQQQQPPTSPLAEQHQINQFKKKKKKGFQRPPLNLSLSFTFNRQSLINQLLGKKNSLELLELMEKIQQANTISNELGEKCQFSLKVKYSLGDMLYFVQLKNEIKKQITDLPKKVFLERVVWMNDYYNKVLFSHHSLLIQNYQIPFDENPFHKYLCYSIGSTTLDLSNFLKKRDVLKTIPLLDEEMHITGRLHVIIDDCSLDDDDDEHEHNNLEYLYNQHQRKNQEKEEEVLNDDPFLLEKQEQEEGEILEGEVLYLRFRVLECDGIPSKYIRDAHIRWTIGDDQEWMESRHVSHNIIYDDDSDDSDNNEHDSSEEEEKKGVHMYSNQEDQHQEGGKFKFPTGEMFYVQREIFSEEDLFMEIRLFGELFKFCTSKHQHSKFYHNRSLSRTRLLQRSKSLSRDSSEQEQLSLSQKILENSLEKYKKITVSCLKAKNLKNVRMFKFLKLNPYCKVKFRETKGKTDIVKGTAYPEWKKKLSFRMIDPSHSEVIVVEVMNRETFLKNTLIGRCFVPLSKCEELSSKGVSEWFSLRHPNASKGKSSSKFSGKVKLAFEMV